MSIEFGESKINPIQEITRLVENFLDMNRWDFKESFRSEKTKEIVYNSQWCRIRIGWRGWDYLSGNSIYIYYGRLHASNDGGKIIYKSEKCHCWHDIDLVLNFLDGSTPQEAVDQMKIDQRWPKMMEQYRQSELGKSISEKHGQPQWLICMHAAIWAHYELRLFELFDLRRPDLWEQYRKFLKEYYDIKGRSPNIRPSPDQVC